MAISVLTTRLEQALLDVNRKSGRSYQLSFSFGVASFDPFAPVPMETLLVEADTRMYEAKMRRRRVRTSPLPFAASALGRPTRASGPPS